MVIFKEGFFSHKVWDPLTVPTSNGASEESVCGVSLL